MTAGSQARIVMAASARLLDLRLVVVPAHPLEFLHDRLAELAGLAGLGVDAVGRGRLLLGTGVRSLGHLLLVVVDCEATGLDLGLSLHVRSSALLSPGAPCSLASIDNCRRRLGYLTPRLQRVDVQAAVG